jgi:hypothetical protein
MNVQYDEMAKKYGDVEAARRCDEIEALGGFGDRQSRNTGGLDIYGVIELSNTAISEKDKDRIAELSGFERKDADKMTKTGKSTTGRDIISPDKLVEGSISGQQVSNIK